MLIAALDNVLLWIITLITTLDKRDGGAGFPVFLGLGVFQGGVVNKRRSHMAVEKTGQVEPFFRQVGSVPLEPHALLFRQRQPDGIVLVELHFHVFLPVTDGR